MLLKELFSKASENEIRKALNEKNIQIPDRYEFAETNIIIGPNGSGKTRFLNALKELYGLCGRKVLYGYFPALSDKKIPNEKRGGELPEWTLYESLYDEDVSFSDFFQEIERQNEAFIPTLLIYQSQRQKKLGEKALQIVFESFQILTGKELIKQEERLFIRRTDGSQEQLSDALKTLSPGELMLFYMSIFLAIQQNGKKNKVIILDEPESHLHPKALLSFLKMLKQTGDFQEIWIATHSLFIVPEFSFEEITYIYDSSVQKRTSKLYQNILSEVLGDEEGKTGSFFASLSQWQYCEFLAECFTNPNVIDTVNAQDEQVRLFTDCLQENRTYRILDCGGGSGRLGLSLKAARNGRLVQRPNTEKSIRFGVTIGRSRDMQNICYEIYDREPSYTGKEFKVYTDWGEIEAVNGPEMLYDCVVMMNFLHEVEPKEWVQMFHKVYSVLKDKGHLVFVEAAALSQGEMPNQSGYFVLGKEELEILFGCPMELEEIRHKETQKSCCILVPREKLMMVSDRQVNMTIMYLKQRMLNNIKEIRQKENACERKGRGGRYYAFLTQQYMNAELFLEMTAEADEKIEAHLQEGINRFAERRKKLEEIIARKGKIPLDFYAGITAAVWREFVRMARLFEIYKYVSEQNRTECLKMIQKMEREHADKRSIALLLVILALMGDSRGTNIIMNNKYYKYLPEEMRDFRTWISQFD